jgi:hypothetical protein
MILDAAETVLGLFGFDRSAYSTTKKLQGSHMLVSYRYLGEL